jgi:hypothetical protein
MIELLFMTCLTASPSDCQERSLVYHGMSPMICMVVAQSELARWANEHPGHAIASWRCGWVRLSDQET